MITWQYSRTVRRLGRWAALAVGVPAAVVLVAGTGAVVGHRVATVVLRLYGDAR